MRKNYPRNSHRDPEEFYDHIYRSFPDRPELSRIIDHPRKLVIHNIDADPYFSAPEEILYERTCYQDEAQN